MCPGRNEPCHIDVLCFHCRLLVWGIHYDCRIKPAEGQWKPGNSMLTAISFISLTSVADSFGGFFLNLPRLMEIAG